MGEPLRSPMDAVAAGGDRLSSLGDGVLGHILSFLPAVETARATVLSRVLRRECGGS
ncbi:hypothetical protein ACP4OV_002232 [Aristida adscensionis]